MRWPTGFEPVPRGSQPRVLPLHHGHHEAGTTGLEPATSRLTSERSAQLSYAPRVEGGRRDRLPATGGRDVAVSVRLRSQLLPIGTPASACPRRHLLTGWPWRLVEASCTLGPALCTSPCSVTSSSPPVGGLHSSSSAGGIRTHDLELMRLARTAAPLPRKSGWQESNLRSPAPKAGGVASSPTARRRTSTPGGTRTRSFRVESPASSPFSTTGA